jgi:4-amino-4-deoxy-L-arabinose transferase-like glycosyltransferase
VSRDPSHRLEWTCLLALVAAAAVARLWAADWGLPGMGHYDEPLTVEKAKAMLDTGAWNPRWFNYPTFSIYLQAGVIAVVRAIAGPLDETQSRVVLYTAARCATALLGTGAVAAAALAARALWGATSGLAAAFALGAAFLHVQESHYVKPDVPASFWTALCLWMSARVLVRDDDRVSLVAAGAAAGIAAATKYNAGLVLLLPLAVSVTRPGAALAHRLRAASLAVAACAIAMAIAFPWIALTPLAVLRDVWMEVEHYRDPQLGREESGLGYFLDYLLWQGLTPGIALAAVLGAVVAWRRDRRVAIALLAFPVPYLLMLGGMRYRVARNLVPMLPFAAAFAGLGASAAAAWCASLRPSAARVPVAAMLLAAFVAWPLARVVLYDRALSQPGTLIQAARWLDDRAGGGAQPCADFFRPKLLQRAQVRLLGALTRAPDAYAADGCGVMVVTSEVYGPIVAEPDRYPERARAYRALFEEKPLLAEFRHSRHPIVRLALGDEIDMYGPIVRIYDLGPSGAGAAVGRGAP